MEKKWLKSCIHGIICLPLQRNSKKEQAMNTKIKTEERIERIIKAIGKSSLPRRELIADLGLRQESRRNFYTNYLNPARDRGLVTMQFPGVPSKPEQTYRLTEKGLEYLDELSKKEQAI